MKTIEGLTNIQEIPDKKVILFRADTYLINEEDLSLAGMGIGLSTETITQIVFNIFDVHLFAKDEEGTMIFVKFLQDPILLVGVDFEDFTHLYTYFISNYYL